MELEWLKKKLPTSTEAKRALIEPSHPAVSLVRQCELMEHSIAPPYHFTRHTPTLPTKNRRALALAARCAIIALHACHPRCCAVAGVSNSPPHFHCNKGVPECVNNSETRKSERLL